MRRRRVVRDGYNALLDGITNAFDERRVRETDKLGKVALIAAFVLSGFGVVTESYGAGLLGHINPNGTLLPFVIVLIATSVLFAAVTVSLWYRFVVHKMGALKVSAKFRQQYEVVREYLVRCRTDRLERLRTKWRQEVYRKINIERCSEADAVKAVNEFTAEWTALDKEFSEKLAQVIDGLRASFCTKEAPDPDLYELPALSDAIERCALIVMLVSERPRSFHGFKLPWLTFFYRFYPIIGSELFSTSDRSHTGEYLVSNADLWLMLRRQCSARPEDFITVIRWGRWLTKMAQEENQQKMPSANGVLTKIKETGLQCK